MKTVLLFRSSFCRSNLLEYEDVFAYAKAHGWRIQTVEYMSAATNRYRLEGADTVPTISSLLQLWKPAGCIVECGIAPDTLMKKDFGRFFRRYTGMSPREWKKQPQSASRSEGT